MVTRRQFTAGAAGIVATAAAAAALARAGVAPGYSRSLGEPVPIPVGKTVVARLVAAERPTALACFGGRPLPMWTFSDGAWPAVLRLNLGDRLEASLENKLPRPDEITSIHWHGIRLPNNQDGVPYLVQPPVRPGEIFRYSFVPPDTGTFFFHTHCNTVEQLGRGLLGVLIVDGDTAEPYDADTVLVMRDWHVDPAAGEFTPFFTLRGAGRAGTFGPVRSVNGAVNPEIRLPAAGDCRMRLINADVTRIMQIGIEGAEAAIMAIDGIAISPVPLTSWSMGPATRIDVVLRAPQGTRIARLVDRSTPQRVELAHFAGSGEPRRKSRFSPAPLRAGRIAEPDLKTATRMSFAFHASDDGRLVAAPDDGSGGPLGEICRSSRTFWTINDRAWPERDHSRLPPPLALLQRGQSYVFQLKNSSEFSHPIHIHGHTFKLLRSNKQNRPEHHTDTLLLLPEEQAEVAFVADNPGDWMFHCHIIEHQETGMMGYIRVV
jgi:FtsP/CotA-like multicopper oxidase with cupredoxin domain